MLNGTENTAGKITEMVELRMKIGKRHQEKMYFAVTNLQSHEIFLGYDWLQQHNPEVDWKKGSFVVTMPRRM